MRQRIAEGVAEKEPRASPDAATIPERDEARVANVRGPAAPRDAPIPQKVCYARLERR